MKPSVRFASVPALAGLLLLCGAAKLLAAPATPPVLTPPVPTAPATPPVLTPPAPTAPATPPVLTPPVPTRWVTDEARFLSDSTRTQLDGSLESFERGSHHQFLLWIGRTTGNVPIEDWAARTFAAWRVGRKGIEDGVVLFVLSEDRKVRIEVGYGLEGQLPDLTASRIIRDVIVPRMKAGDRDGAARAGVTAILTALGATITTREGDTAIEQQPLSIFGWAKLIAMGLILVLALIFFITHPTLALAMLATMASNRGNGRRGGGLSGGGFSGGGGRSGGGGGTGSW